VAAVAEVGAIADVNVQHLFTVADRFQIEERGCVLVPGLPTEPGSPNVPRGARIRLRRPDGSETDTIIKEMEMISYRKRPEKICIPILLPKDITKEDVPVGTEVFLL
jgi:hypothetical protein